EPALHAPVGLQPRDVLIAEEDLARRGDEHAREQVDERGLARAVGADERMAGAHGKREAHAAYRDKPAEALHQPLGAQRRRHRRFHRAAIASSPPMTPLRAKNTKTTSSRPSQNCQYTGLMPER